MFQQFGRALIFLGVAMIIVGALVWIGGRLGLGSLPGDFRLTGERWGCYIPLVSSLIISIVLTLLLNLLFRLFK